MGPGTGLCWGPSAGPPEGGEQRGHGTALSSCICSSHPTAAAWVSLPETEPALYEPQCLQSLQSERLCVPVVRKAASSAPAE